MIVHYQEVLHHKNDCWAHTLSRATELPYEEVYRMMDPLKDEDGSLRPEFVFGLLIKYNWKEKRVRIKLKNLVKKYKNLVNMVAILYSQGSGYLHLVYISGDIVYSHNSTPECFEEMTNDIVIKIFWRERVI